MLPLALKQPLRALAGLGLLLCPPLMAAPTVDAAAWMGVKGARAEPVGESVFGGSVMLYRAGKAGADAVVLLHGLGPNGARDWARVVPALAPHYDVFALDLPGFGLSGKGNELYSPENMVRVIEQAVAPRVGRPFALVGHSMGAAVALGYAAAHPQRVRRLVLADMAGVLHGAVYGQSLARFGVGQVAAGVPADAPWLDSVLRRLMTKIDSMPVSRDMILRTPQMRQQLLRGDPGVIAAFALGEHDFSEALRKVAAPTLLIWGSDDQVAPLRTGQLANALIANSRLELVPGAAHSPQLEQPARFNALLLEELAGTRPPLPPAARGGPIQGKAEKCDGKAGARFSGDMPKLTLIGCSGAEVTGARIGELRVFESDVRIIDSEIREGLYAVRSRVQLTAGSVAGAPALSLEDSEVDAAGTRFEGSSPVAANTGKVPLTLWLSVTELRLAGMESRYVHDSVRLAPGAGW